MVRFERTLAAAGLYVERAESVDDLEELIDEVIAIADELDRQVQQVQQGPRSIGDRDGWNHSA